jgi:hypothetical protein
MAIAAIGSIGGAFQAASAFLRFRADPSPPTARHDLPASGRHRVGSEVGPATAMSDLLDSAFTPGEPYFEAVAAALDEAGYLGA